MVCSIRAKMPRWTLVEYVITWSSGVTGFQEIISTKRLSRKGLTISISVDLKTVYKEKGLPWQAGYPSKRVTLKPWPNGVASRRKLKTWVYLRLRLARPCVHLLWLAMTYPHFGRDQICTQVKASFSLFGHLSQVNASWETSINLLLANKIEDSLP